MIGLGIARLLISKTQTGCYGKPDQMSGCPTLPSQPAPTVFRTEVAQGTVLAQGQDSSFLTIILLLIVELLRGYV